MTIEKLAEQLYPLTTYKNIWEDAATKREQQAFKRGLEIAKEFGIWLGAEATFNQEINEQFTQFLTENYEKVSR